MYRHTNIGKYICHKCLNKIPAEVLEAVFHEQLRTFVFSPEDITNYLDGAVQTIREKEELLQTMEREKKKVEAEMDAMMNLYLAGEIKKEGFGKRYGPLEDRVEQMDKQIPALQGEIDFLRIQQLSSDQTIEEAKDFYSHWNDLSESDKRQVVESITDSILVGTDEVEINLCYLPSTPELMTTWRHNLKVVLCSPVRHKREYPQGFRRFPLKTSCFSQRQNVYISDDCLMRKSIKKIWLLPI